MAKQLSAFPPVTEWISETGRMSAGVLMNALIEQQRLTAYWRERALTDSLTGLPNRAALLKHLDDALADERKLGAPYHEIKDDKRKDDIHTPIGVAIGFIDLDGFKKINDTYGHDAGDKVLQEVGRFLTETLRDSDVWDIYEVPNTSPEMAGRLGGDEFVMVLRHTDTQHLERRKTDIEATLNMLSIDYKTPDGQTVNIPIRGTLGLIDCDLNASADANMHHADQVMYTHKQARKQAEIDKVEAAEREANSRRFAQMFTALLPK